MPASPYFGAVFCWLRSPWSSPLSATISPLPTSFITAIAIFPAPYKFATLWSGQEGSLLFWSLLLSGYGFVLRLRYKTDPRLFAYASVVLAGVQIFFLALVNFAAQPFGLLEGPARADGSGLNPLLQYPEMVIHPPMLYLGYVGFTVPFAFALGALIMKYPGEKWIHITRRWTMVTWGFLTCGIFLGAHWAYSVLGWGGYWGWDPVENASLMPWLVGTAFLHSVMMQEKRGMLKVWNMWLVFATFWLAILGTFLTRSGIISSVHAFAQSSIGNWFAWFLAISFAVFVFFFVKNKEHLRSEHKLESLISRESSFLFNNLLFVLLCFTVLWGTWFPKISELVQGNKVTVGAPFYNRVAIPVALLLLILTAVGPLLAWRKTSFESLKRNFLWPSIGAIAVMVFLMLTPGVLGIALRPPPLAGRLLLLFADGDWPVGAGRAHHRQRVLPRRQSDFESHGPGHVRLDGAADASQHAPLRRIHRSLRRYRRDHWISWRRLQSGSKSRKGGIRRQDDIGNYELVCRSYTQDDGPNYASEWAIMDVYQNGNKVDTLTPSAASIRRAGRLRPSRSIRSTMKEDLYLVYEGQNQDKGQPIIKAHLNPLVMWIWLGVWIMLGGTVLALIPNAPAPVRAPAGPSRLVEQRGAGWSREID